MHYKIGVTCVPGIQWTHVLYLVVITRQSNPPISQFNSLCNEFTSVLVKLFPCNSNELERIVSSSL